MKISQAKSIYALQLDALCSRKRELSKMLQDDSGSEQALYDRVELSRELSEVEKQYDQTSSAMERLQQRESSIHDAQVARQQGEAMAGAMDDMAKCIEIARRIAEGAKVPSADEKMLMEYSHELYMAAKNMAVMNVHKEQKEYDSLLEAEDGAPEAEKGASEIPGGAQVDIQLPEAAAQEMPSAAQ